MNARTCCREASQWLAPSIGLALILKCPMCVAAYVATITGAGISLHTAAGIRWGLLILCISAIGLVGIRAALRLVAKSNNERWHRHSCR